jgi:NAD(P)H-hydrate repair Nnr-like enzyme with NAD(P)H-hydrate epimerase domain
MRSVAARVWAAVVERGQDARTARPDEERTRNRLCTGLCTGTGDGICAARPLVDDGRRHVALISFNDEGLTVRLTVTYSFRAIPTIFAVAHIRTRRSTKHHFSRRLQ